MVLGSAVSAAPALPTSVLMLTSNGRLALAAASRLGSAFAPV